MEKNKKRKVIINSALAGILATSGVIAAATALTSCNISVSAGTGKPGDNQQLPTKNPGFSNFIENIEKNDVPLLDEIAKEPLVPNQEKFTPSGSSQQVKYTKSYIMNSQLYKDEVQKSKDQLFNVAQKYVIDKINSIFSDGADEFNKIANITKSGSKIIIAYQLSKKPIEEEIPPVENPDQTLPEENSNNTRIKLQPFFAFQYIFDFKNVKFDINQDSFLVVNGIESDAQLDMNGKISDLPSDMLIDLNNEAKIFNKQFENVYFGKNVLEPFENWNKSKITNQGFLNSVLLQVRNAAQAKVNDIKFNISLIYDILQAAKTNPTLKNFLIKIKTNVLDVLKKANTNKAVITLVEDLYKPDLKYGTALFPKQGTLRYDIEQLGKAGVINPILSPAISIFLSMFPQKGHPVDEFLELPNLLEKMGPAAVEKKIKSIPLVGKKIVEALKPKAPKIREVFAFIMNIVNNCPNKKLADMNIFGFMFDEKLKTIFLPYIDSFIRKNVTGKAREKLNKLAPFIRSWSFNPQILEGIIDDFTSFAHRTKKVAFSKWNEPIWTDRISLKTFINNHTTFEYDTNKETISPNPDGQTFSIDATYKMNFNKELYLGLHQRKNIFGGTMVKEFMAALDVSLPNLSIVRKMVLADTLPNFLTIKPKDSIIIRIKDDRAFIVPTKNGYTIKAKQSFTPSFSNSINEFFFDFLQNIPLIAEPIVKNKLAPFKKPFNEYYFKSSMPMQVVKNIEDQNNSMKLQEFYFDGNEIDNSVQNINKIKQNILTPYVSSHIWGYNNSINFVNDINEQSIKDQILRELGLNPDIYRNKSKFILKMKPGFSTSASTTTAPKMSGISLEISFNVPVPIKGTENKTIVNELIINNITY